MVCEFYLKKKEKTGSEVKMFQKFTPSLKFKKTFTT